MDRPLLSEGPVKHLMVDADLGGGGSVQLGVDDRHRLRRVLRMRPNDRLMACDGRGHKVPCIWTGAALEPLEQATTVAPQRPRIELGVGLLKGPRWEWLVEKCVEVGVDAIVPLQLDHCVARVPTRDDRLARWQGVATAAAEQSGRCWSAEVKSPARLDEWLASSAEPLLFGDERLTEPTIGEWYHRSERPDAIRLLVGPEGGLSAKERQTLDCTVAHGFALAPWVLRAETAAVTAVFALRAAADWQKSLGAPGVLC